MHIVWCISFSFVYIFTIIFRFFQITPARYEAEHLHAVSHEQYFSTYRFLDIWLWVLNDAVDYICVNCKNMLEMMIIFHICKRVEFHSNLTCDLLNKSKSFKHKICKDYTRKSFIHFQFAFQIEKNHNLGKKCNSSL